ncbi:MAG: PD40 domain-containing protein [Calditrichae bacterium]|nr:PD40 domain-containing protein [Calditrichia bacterium]
MFKSFIAAILAFFLFLMLSCSGSKSTVGETPAFADQSIQQQVEDLQDKIDDNPANPEYRRQLAQLYHDNGRSIDAMKVLESGLALDPNDSETKYLYGQIADEAGDKKRAYTAYKEVLQGSDGNDYLDRIAPKFVDAFAVTKIIGTSANEAYGCFSEDGDKIVYQCDQDGNWDLFEYTISSSTTNQLTKTPAHEEAPVYNPKTMNIAYTSTREDHRKINESLKVRDIFIFNRETDRHMNVTLNSSDDWKPKYSKDGKFISFVSERDDLREVDFFDLKGEVYIMENDGRFQLRVTKNQVNDGGACIAPGSTSEKGTIYYDSDMDGKFEIYKISFKGDKISRLTFNPESNDVSPDISSNGDKITFISDRDGNFEIYMMNSDGSAQMRLTSNPADDACPVFSPDGSKVLFHSNRSGNYDLYLLDLTKQSSTPALFEVVNNIDQALKTL